MSQAGIFISGSFPAHPVETLQGNVGGPVGPDGSGNIKILGNGTSVIFDGTVAPNELFLTVTGGALNWVVQNVNLNPMVANTGYITNNNAATVVLTLPIGNKNDIIRVGGLGTGLNDIPWQILTNGQTIVGAAGVASTSLTSGAQYDTIELVCIVAATTWYILSSNGNFTSV